ncbi:MAG TPA: L,D-transpeptidase [Anaerolineaceae bacterium]|nr:L,D-transpeptidase [Anaerolineaceae bacterium]HOH19531.1 L,D-transpeptidase [Anaerolineaceae bacterium]HPA34132.1 L,D-transpeptidase [Anaerolineaceae bacterium]HQH34459.1 L,D-transpeptidase [Anaerolineaceae bacterium]HQL38675.1 L,D-transpeptidase [Anaerolineaceae bacterium]
MFKRRISRREFLKLSLAGAGAAVFLSMGQWKVAGQDFPQASRLGRVLAKLDLKARPSMDSQSTGTLFDDGIVVWEREVMGEPFPMYPTNRRWIQTPEGYLPAPLVQPVENIRNIPLQSLPETDDGTGMWAEVTVPYTIGYLAAQAPSSPLLKELPPDRYRLYYSQVYWIDDVQVNSAGMTLYRVREKHGSYGDVFWADAEAFRPILENDIAPIRPDVTDKRIEINLTKQTLSCFEGQQEVHFCRISSGAKFDAEGNVVDKWATPVGDYHVINRKFHSLHMAGGSAASGYELFAVSWVSIFATGGVAIHSTYWHNNYGEPMSHGCVNVRPDDAKFIYRWSLPNVPYGLGKKEVLGYDNVTQVSVREMI